MGPSWVLYGATNRGSDSLVDVNADLDEVMEQVEERLRPSREANLANKVRRDAKIADAVDAHDLAKSASR